MQQPLADPRSHHMPHSSTLLSAYARPTPARAFPGIGALSALPQDAIVNTLALILAWKPGVVACLGKIVWWLLPWLRGA
jgi:hypothetical protein